MAGARAGLAINPGTAVEAQRLHDLERGGVGEYLDVGGGEDAGVLGDDGCGGALGDGVEVGFAPAQAFSRNADWWTPSVTQYRFRWTRPT